MKMIEELACSFCAFPDLSTSQNNDIAFLFATSFREVLQ
jgi:hypothetical protein